MAKYVKKINSIVVVGTGVGGGITSLNGLIGAVQTFTNDTNITIVSSGSAHVVTWSGTLADGRIASASVWNGKQDGSANLTSLSGLTYVSGAFVKMTGANTFTLDTNNYLSGIVSPVDGGTGIANLVGSTITLGGALSITGAFTTTLSVTANTSLTLPDSGTLYGTKTASITSAQLLNSLTDATGTGVSAFGTSPTFTTSIIGSASFTLLNTSTTITGFVASTLGTLFANTATQTVNIATGATISGATKTINIGTLGVSGSTTLVNIGSAVSGANTTVKFNAGSLETLSTTTGFFGQTTSPNLFVNATTVQICGGSTASNVTLNLMYNPTGSGNTKTINIGSTGLSGSITNLFFGSATVGALGTATFYSATNSFINGWTSAGNVALTGTAKIATYAGNPTIGNGVASILGTFSVIGRTLVYTSQSIMTIPTTGVYEVVVGINCATPADFTNLTLNYTSGGVGQTHDKLNLFIVGVRSTETYLISCDASTALTFTTAITGSPTHDILIYVKRIA